MTMNIPALDDPLWRNLVTGNILCNCNYFAVKLLLGALSHSVSKDPSSANIARCGATLREFFLRNADQPLIRNDLQKITIKEANSET